MEIGRKGEGQERAVRGMSRETPMRNQPCKEDGPCGSTRPKLQGWPHSPPSAGDKLLRPYDSPTAEPAP